MAQLTGTLIVARSRVFAQDTATTDPAVSDANYLILLNDVLMRYTRDVRQKTSIIPASTSGLTFAANDVVVTTSVDMGEILSFHSSDTTAANDLLSEALSVWTVRDMLEAHRASGAGTVSGGGSEWLAVAWEKVVEGTTSEKARVYVWPPLSVTRYLTVRTSPDTLIAALTDTPDISVHDAYTVARLLAWEGARLHTRDEAFLQQILAPLPKEVLQSYFQSGLKAAFMPSSVRETGALDG